MIWAIRTYNVILFIFRCRTNRLFVDFVTRMYVHLYINIRNTYICLYAVLKATTSTNDSRQHREKKCERKINSTNSNVCTHVFTWFYQNRCWWSWYRFVASICSTYAKYADSLFCSQNSKKKNLHFAKSNSILFAKHTKVYMYTQ